MAASATIARPRSDPTPAFPVAPPTHRRRTEAGLLVLAGLVTASAGLLATLGATHSVSRSYEEMLGAIVLLPFLAHLANRRLAPEADPVLLPVVSLLNGLGWVMIARLDHAVHSDYAPRQVLWTALGIVVYIVTLAVLRRPRDLERHRYLWALGGVGLLLLPLVPHLGEDINGARLWIRLGPITFQPVEVAKIALVVFFASIFVEKRELLSHATARLRNHRVPDPRPFGPILLAWGFSMLAMVAERNVGFALLIFVIFLSMLWMATGRVSYLGVGALLFVAGAFVGNFLFAQVHERITIWLNPWPYAQTIGYQVIQAEYAFGTGGIAGTGLGLGHPGFIPIVQSDFIFAAFGEELGLFGTTLLVVAFALLVGSGLRVALRARSDFSKLLAAGLITVLGFQAFFIMAGVVRLLPLTGLTLPFVAYGGSSLAANYLLIALVMRVSDEGERAALRQGRSPRPARRSSP